MRFAATGLCALLLAACGSSQPRLTAAEEAAILDVEDPAAAPEPRVAEGEADGLPARTSCYFGELMVARPGEEATSQGALLVKLTMDPQRSRMVQETWSFPLYERYVITRRIDGDRFELVQDGGSFAGSGTLEGEPWIWRAWSATATSEGDDTRVESATHFEDGNLVTHERVLDAAGDLRVEVHHDLAEIPLAECNNMFAKARTNAEKLRAASAAE